MKKVHLWPNEHAALRSFCVSAGLHRTDVRDPEDSGGVVAAWLEVKEDRHEEGVTAQRQHHQHPAKLNCDRVEVWNVLWEV